jgi:hypothetical protein
MFLLEPPRLELDGEELHIPRRIDIALPRDWLPRYAAVLREKLISAKMGNDL